MAKRKDRRPNLPEEALARARAELYGDTAAPPAQPAPATDEPPERKKPAPALRTPLRTIQELQEEYSYVIRDLRSMGILAAILIVGMIVAALIIV